MVRIYQPEREDGLVEWRVPGKRRPTRTIRLDVTRSESGFTRETSARRARTTPGTDEAGTVRRPGRAGERREGSTRADAVEQPAADVKSA